MIEYWKNLDPRNLFYIDENGIVQEEEWRDIPNYEGHYQASNLGRIKGLDRMLRFDAKRLKKWKGRILKQRVCAKKGYIKCCLLKNGKYNHTLAHILVARSWILNPLNLPQVNHIGLKEDGREGNKLDNRAVSLQWVTASENGKHASKHGLLKTRVGESCNYSKLTEFEVLQIRKIGKSKPYKETAKMFNITVPSVCMIVNRKTWTHLL